MDSENLLLPLFEDVAAIKSKLHDTIQEVQAARDIIKIKSMNDIPIPLQQTINENLKCKICMQCLK